MVEPEGGEEEHFPGLEVPFEPAPVRQEEPAAEAEMAAAGGMRSRRSES